MKKYLILIFSILLIAGLGWFLRPQSPAPTPTPPPIQNNGEEHPTCPKLDYVANLNVPAYDGKPWIVLNDNQPFFDTKDLNTESYETYYDLDELGRCTLADAVVGQDLMPTGKRGSISSVKPTGWHSDRYESSLVDGEAIYNRCHLIAYGLCGETANKYNLVTGTRYFNTKGVNDFENKVIEYIRSTNNHVRYRVTPVFTDDNLVCDGQILEAYSIEDHGEAICFNIWAYNVQPGIHIDYLTGDNWRDGESRPEPKEEIKEEKLPLLDEDYEADFVLNTKKRRFHDVSCEGLENMSDKNKENYHGSYNDLIREGYLPDASCIVSEE